MRSVISVTTNVHLNTGVRQTAPGPICCGLRAPHFVKVGNRVNLRSTVNVILNRCSTLYPVIRVTHRRCPIPSVLPRGFVQLPAHLILTHDINDCYINESNTWRIEKELNKARNQQDTDSKTAAALEKYSKINDN